MEFWAVEVKSGEPLKVAPGDGMVLHLSQACLGEPKKERGNETVCLFVTVDGKKFVLGTLFTEKLPQQQFDLIFDKDFEISHNCKSGSVYFYGYTASNPFDEDERESAEESESEEDIPLTTANNGKPVAKPKQEKPAETAKAGASKGKVSDPGKQKVKIVEPKKAAKPSVDDESSDEDMMSEDDDGDDSEDLRFSEDERGSASETSESDEETPKKAKPSKKRPAESAVKTPVQDKKAKATPQKTDGKKAVEHVATPYPSKQTGNKPQANKPKQQTPKSGGSHLCKSCNRTFGSDQALESHSKAKHSGAK